MSENQTPEMLEITSMDQFIKLLVTWHKTHVDVLEHMLKIPEGIDVTIDDVHAVLKEDLHKGFLMGLTVALSELGNLPFVAEFEAPDEPAVH